MVLGAFLLTWQKIRLMADCIWRWPLCYGASKPTPATSRGTGSWRCPVTPHWRLEPVRKSRLGKYHKAVKFITF